MTMTTIARKALLMRGYSTRLPAVAVIAAAIDGLVRAVFHTKPRPMPDQKNRVLISKIDHLGDLLLLARVMPALRDLFPSSRIDLLIGSWSKPLAECIPGIEEIITYDSFFHNRNGGLFARVVAEIRTFRSSLKKIRRNRYDVGIDMRAGMVNAIALMRLGGVRYLVGYETGGFGSLLDQVVPWKPVNEIEKYFEVLRQLGLKETGLETIILNIPAENRRRASELINKSRPVFLHPGCGRAAGWPIASWNQLANLLSRAGWDVFITGNTREFSLGETVSAGIPDVVNLCGAMDLKTFLAAVPHAHLFIGLDSFSTHASVACGVPTILLFNPDTSEEFFPTGDFLILPFRSSARDVIDALLDKYGEAQRGFRGEGTRGGPSET